MNWTDYELLCRLANSKPPTVRVQHIQTKPLDDVGIVGIAVETFGGATFRFSMSFYFIVWTSYYEAFRKFLHRFLDDRRMIRFELPSNFLFKLVFDSWRPFQWSSMREAMWKCSWRCSWRCATRDGNHLPERSFDNLLAWKAVERSSNSLSMNLSTNHSMNRLETLIWESQRDSNRIGKDSLPKRILERGSTNRIEKIHKDHTQRGMQEESGDSWSLPLTQSTTHSLPLTDALEW